MERVIVAYGSERQVMFRHSAYWWKIICRILSIRNRALWLKSVSRMCEVKGVAR